MKRDPYRDRAEKDRKELLTAGSEKENQDDVKSRLELHGKKREEKKSNKKPFPLIGLLLASFVLLPLTVVLVSIFFFSNSDSGITNATLENSNEFQIEKNRETALSDKAEPVLAGVTNEEESESEDAIEEASEETTEEVPEEAPAEEVQEEAPEEPAESQEAPEEPQDQPAEEEAPEQPSGSTHTVQANETLYRISVNYGLGPDGVEQLRQLNNLGDNEIYVGQVLQLP